MKKFLSIFVAFLIIFGAISNVEAASTLTQREKIDWMVSEDILSGRRLNANGSTDLALDSKITRAEITKLLVFVLNEQSLADSLYGQISPFKDVPRTHWANGYVTVATSARDNIAGGKRVIVGYPNGNFYPEKDVTYGEISAMLVRIVKKNLTTNMERNSTWPDSYINWAREEGIFSGMTVVGNDRAATRRDAFEMIFNAMFEMGLVDVEKSDDASLRSITINGYTAVVNQRDNTVYDISLPASMSVKDIRANDIRITTTNDKATITTPRSSNEGRTWKFEVVAEDMKTIKYYTLSINGGVVVNADTTLESVSVAGYKVVQDLRNKNSYYVNLPSSVDPRYLNDRDFEIVTTNKDAKISRVFTNDGGRSFTFAVISSNGINSSEYTIYTDRYIQKAKAGANLVVNQNYMLTRVDAKAAIDPRSYDINNVEAFYWEVFPNTTSVRNNVLGVVKVFYKDGSSDLVDVLVNVVNQNQLSYRFTVTRLSTGNYRVVPVSGNPDNSVSLNLDATNTVVARLGITNNLPKGYNLERVEWSLIRPATGEYRLDGNNIIVSNLEQGREVTFELVYKR